MPERNDEIGRAHIAEAVYSRKKRRFSAVWIVPIVALLIGLGMVYRSYSNQGPLITIRFKSAAGIEAGKSVVKYKDIVVGKVTDVAFAPDLGSVLVKVRMRKELKGVLREGTKFWIVHARLSVNAVEGLDTLLSGAYIAMEPSKTGQERRSFVGLEEPPIIKASTPGKHFVLEAYDKGSIQVGSPVYYKKLQAGSVTGYHLSPSGNLVLIDVFVRAPYSRYVTDTTRFWNASGIDATIGTNGVDIRTESLTSILVGGIAFDNFDIFGKGHPVEEGHHFNLFRDIKEAHRVNYQKALYFWVYFDESIRGLKEGAPVEFRGVKIGEVVNYFLMGDARTGDFKIPILIKIEPERFNLKGFEGNATTVNMDEKIFRLLVQKGFRAQLENASLITGDLLINLDFFPDAKPVKLGKKDGLYILPSVPATIESLKSNLQSILDRIAGIPFESLGKRFDHILDTLDNDTIPALNRSIHTLDDELVPAFRKLITHTDATMNELRKNYIDANAQIRKRMMRLIDEIQQTTRSIRNLSDYLQRHPESLIRGK